MRHMCNHEMTQFAGKQGSHEPWSSGASKPQTLAPPLALLGVGGGVPRFPHLQKGPLASRRPW